MQLSMRRLAYWKSLIVVCALTPLVVIFMLLSLVSKLVPPVRRIIMDAFFCVMADTTFDRDDYQNSTHNYKFLRAAIRVLYFQEQKVAKPGCKAPNPKILSLDELSEAHLLDLQKNSRPLVVSFGSCT